MQHNEIRYILDSNQRERQLVTVEESNKPRPTRCIELLSIAEEKNLNHGKAWIATAMNVDENSLLPHWGDEFICYVYSN